MSRILVVDDDRTTRHVLSNVLTTAGFAVTAAKDGVAALAAVRKQPVDLLLTDVWMPRMNGLELLERLRDLSTRPRVIVMTSDDTPETLLETVRRQAFTYLKKPIASVDLLQAVRDVLDSPEPPAIEVVSARPEWVELVVPCRREAVDRIQTVMTQLDTDLAPDLRESIAYAFRELLMNAIEWGGKLDPAQTVRISYLRARRMVLYRIADPGPGFNIENLPHAAIGSQSDDPIAHMQVREEKGIRPGGFGLLSVRDTVDELLYNERRNEVVFVKYLEDGVVTRGAKPGD
jgi:CheY-like chemotaxis protein/anti-sigma regulatory factor (Ser/Thr protein kinase)